MKTSKVMGILAIFAVTSLAAVSYARPWRGWKGSEGWGHKSNYQRMYNPQSVVTVKGIVQAVEQIIPLKGMCNGIHLKLKTDSEIKSVHIGPSWFVERQDMKIEEGDVIEAKGSKVEFEGKPVIIAAEVEKEDRVMKLRDEDGFPRWSGSGWGRRRRL